MAGCPFMLFALQERAGGCRKIPVDSARAASAPAAARPTHPESLLKKHSALPELKPLSRRSEPRAEAKAQIRISLPSSHAPKTGLCWKALKRYELGLCSSEKWIMMMLLGWILRAFSVI